MQKITADSPEAKSADIVVKNIARLKELFPEAVAEDGIDFEVLKQLLGGAASEKEEKYSFTWPGKRQARQISLTPSLGTLRPAPEESVSWDTTQNLFIEGDNLEVLKLLQKSYSGKVKMIYIDPPYNTGKDRIYPDDYHDNITNYLKLTKQIDGEGNKLTSNPENSGRYHTNWLNMMYPRLRLAKNLLHDEGVIFISIDDNELGHLQSILNELFGEEYFQANISWQKRYTRSNNTVDFTTVVEHILVYSKSENFTVNLLERTKEADDRYSNPDNDPRGPWKGASFLNPATPQQRPNLCYPIRNPKTGKVTNPSSNAWRRSREEFERLLSDGRLYWGIDGTQPVPAIKMFLSEAREITPINFWDHGYAGNTDDGTQNLKEIFGEKVFDNPKPVQLISRILEHGSDSSSIVLDFFAGSGSSGHAVLAKNVSDKGNRRFILVQLPEQTDNPVYPTISEIGKERIRRVIKKIKADHPDYTGDLGFRVFKLDSSNIRPWNPAADDVAGSLLAYTDNLLPDRTEQDLLYEVLLKFGLDITSPLQEKVFAGHTVYGMGQGVLFACLSKAIAPADVEPIGLGIAAWRKEANPVGESTVIFRDSAFAGDVAKANMTAILQQHGIDNVRSL